MTDERDPGLQALFDSATTIAEDDDFVSRVMADIDSSTRRTVIGWAIAGLLLVPVTWWMAGPVLETLNVVGELLPDSLFTIEQELLAELLAPINSAAGITGLAFLAGWFFYRKIFS